MSNLNGYDSSDLSNLNDIAINKLFSDFGKLFYIMFNVSFPSLPISCKVSNKRSLNPWMTTELINACKKKSNCINFPEGIRKQWHEPNINCLRSS